MEKKMFTGKAIVGLLAACCIVITAPHAAGDEPKVPAPDFKEIYDLVRAHLTGITEVELNDAAVHGLLSTLAPRVLLVGASNAAPATGGISRTSIFDRSMAYVRVSKVGSGLATSIREYLQRVNATNALQGVVLDLRYASGDDYASAAAAADLFVPADRALLRVGAETFDAHEKTNAVAVPVSILVNQETKGAAEALAAALREAGCGLILGSTTPGQAMVYQEFPLSNGQRLRIATGAVQLGNGDVISGLKPDVAVKVSPAEEKLWFNDPFRNPTNPLASANGSTNGLFSTNSVLRRVRINEAELVRERREGLPLDEDEEVPVKKGPPPKPSVHDPVLARALDLLKGLAVMRAAHS